MAGCPIGGAAAASGGGVLVVQADNASALNAATPAKTLRPRALMTDLLEDLTAEPNDPTMAVLAPGPFDFVSKPTS